MDNGFESEDAKKLKMENTRLKKVLRELTVEKNLMEHKLYRAFAKLLTTKKRKIKRLERALKRLQGVDFADEEDNHCDGCRCRSRRRQQRQQQRVGREEADSDVTIDPGSDYGSETDVDDDPSAVSRDVIADPPEANAGAASSSTSKTIAKKTAVVEEESSQGKRSKRGNQGSKVGTSAGEKECVPGTSTRMTRASSGNNASMSDADNEKDASKPSSQSDYEMEDLVDELCS